MNEDMVNELFDELKFRFIHKNWTTEDKWVQIRFLTLLGRTLVENEFVMDAVAHRIRTTWNYEKIERNQGEA